MISDETPFPIEPCKIEDVRYIVFRFQVSTDQKVGGSSPSKRTCLIAELIGSSNSVYRLSSQTNKNGGRSVLAMGSTNRQFLLQRAIPGSVWAPC